MSDLFKLRFLLRSCPGVALLCACLLPSMVSAGDVIPPSPDKPWAPPQLGDYEKQLAQGTAQYESNSVPVNTNQVYDLPALIDLAERSHPQTRVAWEHACQAA